MKNIFLYLLLSLLAFTSSAQKAMIKKGDDHFKKMAYPTAMTYYTKAYKKDSTDQEAVFRLADCYRLTNDRINAEKFYGKAVTMSSATSLQKFYYGQALMNNGKYAQARKWMEDFILEDKADGRGQSFVKAIDSYQNFFSDSSSYTLTKLDINSTNADFGAAIYQDGIVFTSSRKHTEMIERTHAWTNQPFLDLYYARGKENSFRDPEMFANNLQTKYNDGPICFSKSGEEIYFTRNNIEGNKVLKSSNKVVGLKIFKAKKNGNDWSNIEPFQYNSNEYKCGHPALSADGTKLYFSSDMPGGKGGMDLYVCIKAGSGWAKPTNLGDEINTKGNEVFPTLTEDGTLYFASDGHAGIGGLDIFYTTDIGTKYVTPVNAGYPINTSSDDFGMIYDLKNKIGYLSSNRANRGFDDDLYTFKKKSLRIKGIVVLKETGAPIKEAKVELKNGDKTLTVITAENGRFDFKAEFDQNYEIKGQAIDLGDTTMTFTTSSASPLDPFIRLELGKPAEFIMTINVIDADTKAPLPGAMIKEELTLRELGSTDLQGRYIQPVIPEKDEQIVVNMAGYRPKVIMLKGQAGEKPTSLNYTIELISAKDVYPYEAWYKIIYFDLDKFNVRDGDATKTMDEVIAFLKAHPEVKISLGSHTDSRATKEYNEKLSQRRSKSVKDYILSKGVSSKQIGNLSWSGETVMVNQCIDDEPCTEEMHQLNRRTEITVNGIIR